MPDEDSDATRDAARKDYHAPRLTIYSTPRLTVYGNVTELTAKNGGTKGKNDGGPSVDKTAF